MATSTIPVETLKATRRGFLARNRWLLLRRASQLLVLLAFLTALFWESRLLVLGLGSGLFLLVGFVLYGSFNKAMQRPEQLFSASIAELQEDLRHLKAEDAAAE